MEQVILYCPMCRGRVLSTETALSGHPAQRVAGHKFYCPSCEMFVERAPASGSVNTVSESAGLSEGPENRGRTRAAGSNAGGSQRGDMSDQGASQWRKDPKESERNTWKDKN